MKITQTTWYQKFRNHKINGKEVVRLDENNHIEGYEEAKELADSIRDLEAFERRLDTRLLGWVANSLEGTARHLNKWAITVRFLNTELPEEFRKVNPDDEFIQSLESIQIKAPAVYLEMKTDAYLKRENDKI